MLTYFYLNFRQTVLYFLCPIPLHKFQTNLFNFSKIFFIACQLIFFIFIKCWKCKTSYWINWKIYFVLLQPNTSSSSVTRTTSVTPQTDHRMPVKARLGIPAPNLLSLDNTVPKKTETAEKVKILFLHLAIKEKSNYTNHNKCFFGYEIF